MSVIVLNIDIRVPSLKVRIEQHHDKLCIPVSTDANATTNKFYIIQFYIIHTTHYYLLIKRIYAIIE